MNYDYYCYQELLAAALENETPENLEALGNWFENYGERYWNGEHWEASAPNEPSETRYLYPIMVENEDGDFEVTGYTFNESERWGESK